MTKDEALKLALEALEQLQGGCTDSNDGTYEAITVWCPEVIDAIREALAQPEQEPQKQDWKTPPKEDAPLVKWAKEQTPTHCKPLSDVEIWNTYKNLWMFHPAEEPRLTGDVLKFARAIEAAHGIWPENSDCYGPDWTDRDGEYLK